MTDSPDDLIAIITVQCGTCVQRFGRGTRIGEMILLPESEGGRWGWTPLVKHFERVPNAEHRSSFQRRQRLQFGRGTEVKCRRCRSPHRFKICNLAALAGRALADGGVEIVV